MRLISQPNLSAQNTKEKKLVQWIILVDSLSSPIKP